MKIIDENGVEPKPEMLATLTTLKKMGIRIGLATATPEGRARKYLRIVGAETMFDAIACAEMVAHGKPAPDVYLLAAEKLGLKPEDMLTILEAKDRKVAGPTAPPEGLMLMKVDY